MRIGSVVMSRSIWTSGDKRLGNGVTVGNEDMWMHLEMRYGNC